MLLSLHRQLEKQGRQGFATSFYIRRAFWIYPLSMVVVMTVAALPLLSSQTVPSVLTIASNLFLVQNLTGHDSIPAPLWSLPFEIQMYLVLPVLFFAMERSGVKAARMVGFLWIAAVALVIGLWKLELNYHLVKYFPCFIPGAIAYALRETRKTVTPMLLFGYVVACALLMPISVAHGARENVVAWPVCLGLGLLIPRCREVRSRILTRVGKLIARYSYGIYLVHGTCISFTFGAMSSWHPVMQWAGFLAATIGLALIAFHLIEKPGIGLGIALANKWAQRLRPLPEPATPALGE